MRTALRATIAFAALAAWAAHPAASATLDPITPGAWTVAWLPDTQTYTLSHPDLFHAQTRWIAANRDKRNIRFVLHTGDVTENNNDAQWTVARDAMKSVVDAGIPFAIAPGNHDFGPGGNTADRSTLLNAYFSSKDYRHSRRTGYFEPNRLDNSWHTFRAGGRDVIVIALEFGPRDSVVRWADRVLAQHPNHLAILGTHAFIYSDETRYDAISRGRSQLWNPHRYLLGGSLEGTNDGEDLWRKLVTRHPNLRLVLSGHVLYDGAGHVVSFNDEGHVVHQFLANYQHFVTIPDLQNGGDAYLRLIEFQPDGKTVKMRAYSPALDRVMSDSDQSFQFSTNTEDYRRVVAADLAISGDEANGNLSVSVSGGSPLIEAARFKNRANATPNDGDYQMTVGGLGVSHRNGVLLATVRQNGRDDSAIPRLATVEVDRNSFGNDRSAIAVSRAGFPTGVEGVTEMNADVAVAWFPFAGGWRGAHINADGTLEAASDIFANDVRRTAHGRFQITLPGVNAEKGGMLFVQGNNNENRVASTMILPDGRGWIVALRENRQDARDGAEGSVSVLYVPYGAAGLVGGRVADDGSLLQAVGAPDVRREQPGVYRFRVPGQSPDTGVLALTVAKAVQDPMGEPVPDDKILFYEADGDDFIVHSRDTPALVPQDTGFVFAFIGFDKALSLAIPYTSPFPR